MNHKDQKSSQYLLFMHFFYTKPFVWNVSTVDSPLAFYNITYILSSTTLDNCVLYDYIKADDYFHSISYIIKR